MTAGRPETRTTCPYCGVGCGILARPQADGGATVRGDPEHPANFGRLCSKGSALAETIGLEGRLLHPLMGGQRVSWDAALDRVARKFTKAIRDHGPDSVAFYLSGQLLTEDYYVANKLMKGFIGSANIDTNSRLCMASTVAGHKRAFGADAVPGTYADLERADLVVLVGSNLAWCHPVLFQRLQAAKNARPGLTVVTIDPRRTTTAQASDRHLALKPGTDVALFNGLLAHLHANSAGAPDFVARRTRGLDAALKAAGSCDLSAVAHITGLPPAELRAFYELFRRTECVVTVFSQGVNQSSAGTDKVSSIINCHLYTGRIGRPGMGPFSVTGQPNAMGGREVGGLANQLAAHMELDNLEHRRIVQGFWRSPRIADRPGLKAVDLFRAVSAGRIKALWIAGTNPVDSVPEADMVRAALATCSFVVVSDVEQATDTATYADVLLPAAAWGEKDGTVTNSERRISRQRAFLPLPGEAKPDWWIFSRVAQRMGWAEAFDYGSPAAIFAEHAALSGTANNGQRDFDIGGLAGLDRAAFDALAPTQWPAPVHASESPDGRLFGDGRFFTPDRRARFVATPYRAPVSAPSPSFPLVLNTGRVRDQWHTMTRTAKSARLMSHTAEPFVELHPDDAARRGIAPASLAVVESRHGRAIVRARVSPEQQPGSVFVPMHWTGQLAAQARIDALIAGHTDPVSGQPELKFTAVEVRPYRAAWYGFAVLADRPSTPDSEYWAFAKAKVGWRLELAGATAPDDWDAFARTLFGLPASAGGDLLAYHDRSANRYRTAAFRNGQLVGALFVAPEPVAVARAWLTERLSSPDVAQADRLRVLAGRAHVNGTDPGAMVCACFEVGVNQITRAIADGGCTTVDDIGRALRAGTNCGSCRTEIRKLIDAAPIQRVG